MDLYAPLAAAIQSAIPEIAAEDLVFAPAPKPDVGDVALRTFAAAKKLGEAPPKLAARIVEEADFGPLVASAKAAGPYVNFHIDRGSFAQRVVAEVLRKGKDYGSNASGAGRTALIEHTSINPNASPHVGRARNAMIGDAITRLLRFEKYDTTVHYYVNDMGRQIGLLVLAIEERAGEITEATPLNIGFDEVLGIYVEANARAKEDADFAEHGYELLARMEENDEATKAKFRAVTTLCLNGQILVLARLGINYDVFDRESNYVRDPRVDAILKVLEEKGTLFKDEEGRMTVDLQPLGWEADTERYFPLIRSNGSSLYVYRDLAYTIDKSEKGADLNLIVLGEDHKSYFRRQEIILEAAGHRSPEPIYYAYITLKDGKMSTRQGNVVLLSDFLDEAIRRAAEKVEEQCADLPAAERKAIAQKVGVAAVRFAILRVTPTKNVTFEWESALSFSGDTGPYVQYSCARISSILRKLGAVAGTVSEDFPVATDAEWALCRHLAEFDSVVEGALAQRNVAPVAQYALETARLFTGFYHECPVLDAPSDAARMARAQLCQATRQVITNALALLGIEAVERM